MRTNHIARRERYARMIHVDEQRTNPRGPIGAIAGVASNLRWDTIWALQHYRAERRARS